MRFGALVAGRGNGSEPSRAGRDVVIWGACASSLWGSALGPTVRRRRGERRRPKHAAARSLLGQLVVAALVVAGSLTAGVVSSSLESQEAAADEVGLLAAGVPEAPREVWIDRFETGLSTTAASALTTYASNRYTTTGWGAGTNCTGVLVNYTAAYPNASFCPNQSVAIIGQSSVNAREARRLADVLGQLDRQVVGGTAAASPVNGSSTGASGSQANHALVSIPSAAAGGQVVAASAAGIGVSAPGSRYYALQFDAAAAPCGSNAPSLAMSLLSASSATLLNAFPARVNPCAATGNVFYTSPALATVGALDPAVSTSVRASRYLGTGTALLSAADIAAARIQVTNTTTAPGSGFGVDNLRVLEVSPALDVAFEDGAATATVPTTLTYTVTNSSDRLAKSDWGFTTSLPSGLRVASTPAVGGSCTNATGAAYAVTAAAGSGSIAVVGGDLAAAAESCTISIDVVAAAPGTVASGTVQANGLIVSAPANLTVNPATTLTVRKNIVSRAAPGDQFTMSVRSGTTVLGSATTTGTTTGLQAAQVDALVVQPGATYTIHEAPTGGAGLRYDSRYECLRGTTVVAAGAFSSGTITMPDEAGASVVCTFTNSTRTAQLQCDTNHFYSVTETGSLGEADIVTGASTPIGSWSATSANALGVGAVVDAGSSSATAGTIAYAIDRSADATDVASVLRWTPSGGFQTIANSAYTTVANGTEIAGSIVAGAVDRAGGRYIFGKFLNGTFHLWSFVEANPVASRYSYLGSFSAGAGPNGNGDMAFDARGNLYIVGAATVNNVSSAAIFTVAAETIASATGGPLRVSTSTTKALAGLDASPAFGNVNGIAFSPRGTAYISGAGGAYEMDPTTWTRVAGTPRVAVTGATDLAGCTSPSTMTVLKNVVGRASASDQFTTTLANAGGTVATATTSGAATGRQADQIGPVPATVGASFTISEAMAAGSASAIATYTAVYECYAGGVRIANGTSASGSVTMPSQLSVNVVCTFFNSPRPAATVTVTKQILQPSGLLQPAAGWSLGVAAAATTGTATVLPSEAPVQQSNASGQAVWTVLYGSEASRATLTVSETQQTGFTFERASCTVDGAAVPTTFSTSGSTVSGTIAATRSGASISCTIVNRPTAQLTLVKRVALGSALPSDFTLTASGPSGALPGPSGRSGAAGANNVPVTPGIAYRLSETGPATYLATGAWVCATAAGQAVTVSAAGDVTVTQGTSVTCTITNATATITLLKQVLDPRPGFQAPDWRLSATPAALTGASLPTQTRVGAEYSAAGNPESTFEVRPNWSYTLAEAPAAAGGRLAYKTLRLERLQGSTWITVPSASITSPAPGQSAVYRFVNEPVAPTTLPLTGGQSADTYLIAGAAVSALALLLAAIYLRRRRGRPIM